MNSTDKKTNYLELWKRGVSLDAAAYKYAHSDLQNEYDRICNAEVEEEEIEPLGDDASWGQAILAGLEQISPYANAYVERGRAFGRLRDYLIRLIAHDHVVAFGYAIPRKSEDFPKSIPDDIWSGKIEWEKSQVVGNGLEFVAVRVVPSTAEKELFGERQQGFLPEPTKKLGRPPVGPRVVEAYTALKEGGRINYNVSMTNLYPSLRKWLADHYPDNAAQLGNISDETIRKEITHIFKNDKGVQ